MEINSNPTSAAVFGLFGSNPTSSSTITFGSNRTSVSATSFGSFGSNISSNPTSSFSLMKSVKKDNLSMLFKKACKDNKVEIAQWIYSVVEDKDDLGYEDEIIDLFRYSCVKGYLELAQFLHPIVSNTIEEDYSYEYFFVKCVMKNHFSIAQWLLSIKPDINILDFDGDTIFKLIFHPLRDNPNYFGQIQFLYSLNNTLMIEHIHEIFSKAIENNKVDLLQWCEEIKPELSSIYTTPDGEQLFKNACSERHIELVHYIKSKNPDKYHFIMNEDGTITSNIEYILNIRNTKSVEHIDTCSICYEESSSVVTICDHQYCKTCIQQWLNVRTECPYCRKTLDMDNLFMISK